MCCFHWTSVDWTGKTQARSVATLGWEKEKSGARARSNLEDPATSALQENGCRLAILEYLIRVNNRCSQPLDILFEADL